MTLAELAAVLDTLGCPKDRCQLMAEQLHKRACQLSTAKGRPYDEALEHLLKLMSQGWAAQQKQNGR